MLDMTTDHSKPDDPTGSFFEARVDSGFCYPRVFVRCRVYEGWPIHFYNKVGFGIDVCVNHIRRCYGQWYEANNTEAKRVREEQEEVRRVAIREKRSIGQKERRKREREK